MSIQKHLVLDGRTGRLAASLLAIAASALSSHAFAQDTGTYQADDEDVYLPTSLEGARIDEIALELPEGSSLNPETLLRTFNVQEGDTTEGLSLQEGLERLKAIPGVEDAQYRLELTQNPSRTLLVIEVTEGAAPVASEAETEKASFPNFVKNDRSQVTAILNGAFGFYTDVNPWFGDGSSFTRSSPIATAPALNKTAVWGEANIEFGLGAVTEIGSSSTYLYGAATGMLSGAVGQDLFSDKSRAFLDVEKLYVGLLYADREDKRAVNISIGKQNFNLGDGFLFAFTSGSSNAGPRPGLFLNPRVAFDATVLVDVKLNKVRFKGFLLDPNELEKYESRTRFVGGNVLYSPNEKFNVGLTYVTIDRSKGSVRLPDGSTFDRKGLDTFAFQTRVDDPFNLSGLWLQGEYARQRNEGSVRAWGGYATIGYRFHKSPIVPAFSYRYAAFSGDDPSTSKYERYDPLLSGGLGEWVQGVNFKKVIGNTNANVQRFRFTAKPASNLNLTLDAFNFRARELNNLGGNPALGALNSKDLGKEYTLRLDWFIDKRWYVLGVISHARPGDGLDVASPTKLKPWTTFQASAFWRF